MLAPRPGWVSVRYIGAPFMFLRIERRDCYELGIPIGRQHIDSAPIGKVRDHGVGDALQGSFVLQRFVQDATHAGEETQPFARSLLLRDVRYNSDKSPMAGVFLRDCYILVHPTPLA